MGDNLGPKNPFNFTCSKCDFRCCVKRDYERHLNTAKHKMVTTGDKLGPKNPFNFTCSDCDFRCSKKSQYERHLNTAKHKMVTNGDRLGPNKNTQYICSCGKEFKYRQGLSRHKQNCSGVPIDILSTTVITPISNTNNTDLIDVIVKQQEETTELKKLLIEQQEQHFKHMKEQMKEQQEQMKEQQEQHHKQIQELIPQINQITNINNSTNTNCNNKFNLNFFLNEQCKDAMSIQNFIQNLNIGIKELEHMGDVGYVNGMMNIFSNTLGAMDIYKRPLHCTDLKRETLYIKQGDTWEKDTDDKSSLKKLIKSVERKNYGTLRQWEKQHPDAFECDTPDNIEYMKISTESLGGEQSTDALKLNKIMKHVIREVYVK